METKPELTAADLKEILRELFHTAILAKVAEGDLRLHPLRLLQAVKSILGLDLGAPNTALVSWTRAYVESFSTFPAEELKIRIHPAAGNVAYDDLARAIRAGELQALEEELGKLAGTASAEQLGEFLLEQSLLQAADAFLFVWSAIRMVRFLGPENTPKVLRICALHLLTETGKETVLTDPVVNFECRAALGQLHQETFVRARYILSNADRFEEQLDAIPKVEEGEPVSVGASVETLIRAFRQPHTGIDPAQVAAVSRATSRHWISAFLSALPAERISPDLLLCLDAGRALLKNAPPPQASTIGYALGEILNRIRHA